MRILILAAALIAALSPSSLAARHAQTARALNKIPVFIDRLLAEWHVPGLAVGVVQDDQVVWEKGFGRTPGDQMVWVTVETPFAIGSATKTFTALGLELLVQKGQVDLDQPVATYVPGFKTMDPYLTANLSVRDVLSQRSGFPRHDLVWFASEKSRAELVRAIAVLPYSGGWRERLQYNNLMYALAGYLTEKVSGQRWEDYVRQEILLPLGLTHSDFSFHLSEHGLENAMAPAGGIVSTVGDLLRWVAFFMAKGKAGGKTVLAERLIDEMQTPQTLMSMLPSDNESLMTAYGLGLFISCYRGHYLVYHGGNVKGFSSFVSFLPREKIGVIVLANASLSPVPELVALQIYDRLLDLRPSDWAKKVTQKLFQPENLARQIRDYKSAQRVPDTKPSHALAEYAGVYAHPAYGDLEVRQRDDSLFARWHGLEARLSHHHYDIFILEGLTADLNLQGYGDIEVHFFSDLQGKVSIAEAHFEPEAEPIRLIKKEPEQFISEAYLARFSGVYRSDGMEIVFYAQNGTLFASVGGGREVIELVPEKENLFSFKLQPMMKVEFQVGDAGKATAAILLHPGGQSMATRKPE